MMKKRRYGTPYRLFAGSGTGRNRPRFGQPVQRGIQKLPEKTAIPPLHPVPLRAMMMPILGKFSKNAEKSKKIHSFFPFGD